MMMDYSQLAVAIDAERSDATVLIRPRLENPVPLVLGYRLTVSQAQAGNTSSISQQGELRTGQASSSVRLSAPSGGTCLVHLEVFQEDVLIKAVDRNCAVD